MSRRKTNWHEATVCAIQIDLKEYSQLLKYHSEYILGTKSNYRMDLLVINKISDVPLNHNPISKIFSTYNIFEIKGIHSTLTSDAYYKTQGYAGLFINSYGKTNQLSRKDVTLSFITRKYPRKLIHHLTKDCKLPIVKTSPGVYYIDKEMYRTQIIITSELAPKDNLYLRCLTNQLSDSDLTEQLVQDYKQHQEQELYIRYLNQLTHANTRKDGVTTMYCEGLFELFGTSSKEIKEQATAEANEIITKQADTITEQADIITELSNTIATLKKLLAANGISVV